MTGWESIILIGSHFFVLAIGTDKGRLTNPGTPAFAQCGVVLAALAQLVIVQSFGSLPNADPVSLKRAGVPGLIIIQIALLLAVFGNVIGVLALLLR